MVKIHPSEITPEGVYLNRRQFMKLGALAAGALSLAACAPERSQPATATVNPVVASEVPGETPISEATTDELGDALTPYEDITNFNNYYEFSMDKQSVAERSQKLVTSPWTVTVGGLVNNPRAYAVDELVQKFSPEERIYRLRCVEAWSMVIPWMGFPLNKLLKEVEPASDAKYVRFETLYDPEQMPGQGSGWYQWPYVEGLRLDEAMHDLAILATGLYGKPLPPQDGAPLRLVVPWKYGFKSIKAIVKIDLVADMPTSLWMAAAPNEYGFYANVNPVVDHPRWSQRTERRIGELRRRDTLMMNGYAEEVGSLYNGMDLSVNY
jgi:sulfoxide reductase catalytic subunit YedY